MNALCTYLVLMFLILAGNYDFGDPFSESGNVNYFLTAAAFPEKICRCLKQFCNTRPKLKTNFNAFIIN